MRVVMETVSLANHFLIAMPAMADPSFSRTLTYICEHNAEGAIGIIVNRPTDMNLANLFERVDINLEQGAPEQQYAGLPVYFGGPVQTDRGFVLHRPAGEWQHRASHVSRRLHDFQNGPAMGRRGDGETDRGRRSGDAEKHDGGPAEDFDSASPPFAARELEGVFFCVVRMPSAKRHEITP